MKGYTNTTFTLRLGNIDLLLDFPYFLFHFLVCYIPVFGFNIGLLFDLSPNSTSSTAVQWALWPASLRRLVLNAVKKSRFTINGNTFPKEDLRPNWGKPNKPTLLVALQIHQYINTWGFSSEVENLKWTEIVYPTKNCVFFHD